MKELHDKLDELINKYKDNEYVSNRLKTFIMSHLPSALDNAATTNAERTKRRELLNEKTDNFIRRFIGSNHYYYCSRVEPL